MKYEGSSEGSWPEQENVTKDRFYIIFQPPEIQCTLTTDVQVLRYLLERSLQSESQAFNTYDVIVTLKMAVTQVGIGKNLMVQNL